jgi:transposase
VLDSRLRGNDAISGILYTVIESAKLNGLDPKAYLANTLDGLARGHSSNRLDEQLPWNSTPPLAVAA